MTDTTKTRARPATFNLEDVNKIVGEALDRQRAEMQAAMQAAKPVTNGKSQASMANEIAVVRAFKKAGFGNVTPHVDVKTFNRWMMDGLRPVEGSKSVRVKNLRLFHRSQVRPLTAEEKAPTQEQQQAAVARHKGGKAVPIGTSPQ
jgi:hypothetical protein